VYTTSKTFQVEAAKPCEGLHHIQLFCVIDFLKIEI
jgi:hypothetical protein